MENDVMVICDIPTSVGASYETAKDILAVDAADLKDVKAEIRFLRKEANMFYLTLKKLLAMIILPENVSIQIDIVSLIDM